MIVCPILWLRWHIAALGKEPKKNALVAAMSASGHFENHEASSLQFRKQSTLRYYDCIDSLTPAIVRLACFEKCSRCGHWREWAEQLTYKKPQCSFVLLLKFTPALYFPKIHHLQHMAVWSSRPKISTYSPMSGGPCFQNCHGQYDVCFLPPTRLYLLESGRSWPNVCFFCLVSNFRNRRVHVLEKTFPLLPCLENLQAISAARHENVLRVNGMVTLE
jgi:hypothetical protein